MKLLSSKDTYEISFEEVKLLIANRFQPSVDASKIEVIPLYGWPTGDDNRREISGFEITVTRT